MSPLKQWEVSDLSYQAAQKVVDSKPEEALPHLVDLSQNFPIRARTLVQTKISEAFRKEIQENQAFLNENYNIGEGENALFVNGINIDTDMDVFQLFDTVRSELQLASAFYEMGFRREYLSVLYSQNFGTDSSTYAIDFRDAYPEYLVCILACVCLTTFISEQSRQGQAIFELGQQCESSPSANLHGDAKTDCEKFFQFDFHCRSCSSGIQVVTHSWSFAVRA